MSRGVSSGKVAQIRGWGGWVFQDDTTAHGDLWAIGVAIRSIAGEQGRFVRCSQEEERWQG